MCPPLVLAGLTLAVSAAGAVMQNQAATTQANAVNAQAERGAENAREATVNNYAMQGLRIQQETTASAEQLQRNHVQTLQAESHAVASAGSAGVNGLSVDALLNDLNTQSSNNVGDITQNRDAQIAQDVAGMRGIQLQGDNTVNSYQRAVPPSPASLAIGIVGAGLNAAGTYYQASNQEALIKARLNGGG